MLYVTSSLCIMVSCRAGPIKWPARSSDLNSFDFYLWGHLKTIVCITLTLDIETLCQRNQEGCQLIRQTPGIFEIIRQSTTRQLHACIEADVLAILSTSYDN